MNSNVEREAPAEIPGGDSLNDLVHNEYWGRKADVDGLVQGRVRANGLNKWMVCNTQVYVLIIVPTGFRHHWRVCYTFTIKLQGT